VDDEGAAPRFARSDLNVGRAPRIIVSNATRPGELDVILFELTVQRRDALYAVDYGTGLVELLRQEPNEGRLALPVPVLVEGDRLWLLTVSEDASRTTVRRIDPSDGSVRAEGEVSGAVEGCGAVLEGDFFFTRQDVLLVARGIEGATSTVEPVRLSDASSCGGGLVVFQGGLVSLDRPVAGSPLRLWPVDPSSGDRGPGPLVEIDSGAWNAGLTEPGAPAFAFADGGVYVVSHDAGNLDLRYFPVAGGGDPDLRLHLEPSLFAELLLGPATLSIERTTFLDVQDELAVVGIRLLEDAPDGRFFWHVWVVADLRAGAVDVLSLGAVQQAVVLLPE
jgi:hypothetical protein